MAFFRAVSHVELRGRRVRASATFAVAVSVEESAPADGRATRRKPAVSGWVPAGLQDPGVRWDVLPERIRPEGWTTGQAEAQVPGSILAAEDEHRPQGFATPG